MGKALKTAGMIIGGAVLIATGVGALVGANVAAMGIASFTGSLTIGQLGTLAAGVSAVGTAMDKPKSQGSASPTDWTSNPDQPSPFAFGRVGVAGKIVHRDEFGPDDNMYQGIVGVVSGGGPIRAFVSFSGDDQPVTFNGAGLAVSSQWAGEMWMTRRLGAQPDTALPSPSGLKNGATLPGWTGSHGLSGKACYLQILGENSKRTAFPNGEPEPLHVVEGVFGYDPRLDSTYPGGSGSCRLNDRETWPWIEDPIIAALNWALGMEENGQVVGGIGASLRGIDVPAFVEAANISEANGWKITAWPDTSEDASQVLRQMLQAGGAVYARHAGRISCVSRGAPRAAIVTISGRDTCGPIELDTGSSLFNRLNQVTPRFMSEAHGWKMTPGSPVAFEAYREADGGRRSDSIDYRFVPAGKQAAELAAYDILDGREPFAGTVPLKPHLRRLKRGDCFVIDEPGFLLDGVKCIVLSRAYDTMTGEVRIGFRSETDGKHPLALGQTTTLPTFPTLSPSDPTLVTPPTPIDWTVTPRPPSTGGGRVPGFDLTGVVANATATGLIVEWGPSEEGPWTNEGGVWPPTTTTVPITGVQAGQTYYVAVSYVRGQNISARTIYGPYVAPGIVADDTTTVGGTRAAELLAFYREIPRLIVDGDQASETLIRETLDRHERVVAEETARVAAITAETAARIAALLAEATARGTAIAGVTSSITTVATNLAAEITTRTSQYAATSAAVALVDARVTTVASDLAAETSTRTSQVSTLTTNIAAVNTAVTTVATNLASLTSSVTTQFSTVNGTLASHSTSISTNATAISAETTARTAAISTVNASIAAVAASVTTVASDLASLTTSTTSQFSTVNGTLASHTTSISTNATAISAETTARTSAISTVNASIAAVNTAVTTVATDLAAETTARLALAASTTSGFASVTTSLTALSTADATLASAILNVASQATTRGNLIRNSTGTLGLLHWTAGTGWAVVTSELWGPRFENATNGTVLLQQTAADAFEVAASAWYTMQADFLRTASAGGVWMDIAWLKSDGSASSITPFSARIGTTANRDYGSVLTAEVQAPSDAAKACVRYFLESVSGNTLCGIRRSKVERGRLPATGWTDDRTATTTGSSAIFALSALNGDEAYATIGTNVNDRITLMRINGADQAIDFLAEQFNITSEIGEGIEYDAAEKIFKIYDATSKTVLKASGDIRFWSGPSSVDDGDETAENGVLALGPGLTGGGRFNGQTLTVPFDTGAPSATIIDLSSSYTSIDEFAATMVAGGALQLTMFDLDMSGDATADMDGYRTYEIEWRLVSENTSHGDAETITSGEFSHTLAPGAPVTFFATGQMAFDFYAVTKGGDRLLTLQMRFKSGSATTQASVRNTRMRGWTVS